MNVRYPVVAGMFYPGEKEKLKKSVEGFLARAKSIKTDGQLKVLIVPHAGHEYSGQVAAAGFKQIKGKNYQKIILLGASHSAWFPGVAVYDQGAWETPLGQVKVDEDLAKKLIDPDFQIIGDQQAHLNEHSLEVQLPFLQLLLKDFKIVPLLIGQAQEESLCRLAQLIAKQTLRVGKLRPGAKTLLVVSSDFSHYPDYETAKIVDNKTIEAIKTGDWKKFERTLVQLQDKFPHVDTFCCGARAVKVGLMVAEKLKAKKAVVFEQKNSGDPPIRRTGISGDKSRVVGYASVGFYS